jgi:hypothetical protein
MLAKETGGEEMIFEFRAKDFEDVSICKENRGTLDFFDADKMAEAANDKLQEWFKSQPKEPGLEYERLYFNAMERVKYLERQEHSFVEEIKRLKGTKTDLDGCKEEK